MSAAGAVFLSYASQDAVAARQIAEALRASGVEVWFDQNELVGGDAWDAKIRNQIAECALFVPVISVNSQARLEGYFRREWKQAAARTHDMADEKVFLLPVVIDDTRDAEAKVPAEFKSVQWTRLRLADVSGQAPLVDDQAVRRFCSRVQRLLGVPVDGAADSAPATLRASQNPARGSAARRWWIALVALGGVAALTFVLRWTHSRTQSASLNPVAATPVSGVDSTPLLREISRVLGNRTEIGVFRVSLSTDRLKLLDELAARAIADAPDNPSTWAVATEIDHYFVGANGDVSSSRLEQANQRSARALQLAPTSFDARWARAAFLKSLPSSPADLAEAEVIMRQLVSEWPTHRGARAALASIVSDEGRYAESGELSLQNGMPGLAFWAFYRAGEVDKAEAAARTILAAGAPGGARLLLAKIQMDGREDLDAAFATMQQIPASALLDEDAAMDYFLLLRWRRDGNQAFEVVQRLPREWLSCNSYVGPKCYLAGLAHELAGRRDAAQAEWRKALRLIDQRLAEHENDGGLLRLKAGVLARLGDIDQARVIVALEAQLAGRPANDLSATYELAVLIGREDAVVDWLGKVLRQPGNLSIHPVIRFAAEFDPLRRDPRVAKLLRETVPPGAKPISE